MDVTKARIKCKAKLKENMLNTPFNLFSKVITATKGMKSKISPKIVCNILFIALYYSIE